MAFLVVHTPLKECTLCQQECPEQKEFCSILLQEGQVPLLRPQSAPASPAGWRGPCLMEPLAARKVWECLQAVGASRCHLCSAQLLWPFSFVEEGCPQTAGHRPGGKGGEGFKLPSRIFKREARCCNQSFPWAAGRVTFALQPYRFARTLRARSLSRYTPATWRVIQSQTLAV